VAAIPIQLVELLVVAEACEGAGAAKAGTKPATASVAMATTKTLTRAWNVPSIL
jgi:hypothetical protein